MKRLGKHSGYLTVLLLGVAVGFFLAGQWVPSVSAVSRQDYESLDAFSNILSIVKKNYVEEVDTKNLVTGAINGMLTSLDPHSAYLTPELYKDLQMDTQGRFGGLGIEITVKSGVLTVVSPIEDTPAAKAGIMPGDMIFKIEDEFTKDMSLVDAVKKMRGLKGTKINLSIKRENVPELIDFTLMRDTIRVQSVRSRVLDSGYGYIRLAQFQERSDRDVQKALEKLAAEKGGLKGLVLDLRNNPGRAADSGCADFRLVPRFRFDCLYRRPDRVPEAEILRPKRWLMDGLPGGGSGQRRQRQRFGNRRRRVAGPEARGCSRHQNFRQRLGANDFAARR